VYNLSNADTAANYRQSSLPDSFDGISGFVSDTESALAAGNFFVAESLLRSALPAAPRNVELSHLLGLAVAGGGLADAAITFFRRAVTSDRHQLIYRVALGIAAPENRRPLGQSENTSLRYPSIPCLLKLILIWSICLQILVAG